MFRTRKRPVQCAGLIVSILLSGPLLAAVHFKNRYIQRSHCYVCHTDYGLFGTSDTPRTATVRAVTDLEVLSIHWSYFTSLFSYLPMFRERILAEYEARTAGER